jgi:copper chaperone NosL
MSNKSDLNILSRIAIAFASGMLVTVFFLPAWRIDLFAPQYPEGLMMNIWINKLTGNVDIINGLNHYIGMKPFSEASFPEFKYLQYVVCAYMLFGLLIALTGKKRLLQIYVLLSFVGGSLAIYDFYNWEYKYGHDLDPRAAIQVPGMSYQPPLFGHKRLLNFDAYSFPDIGGWIVIASVVLAILILVFEWYRGKKLKSNRGPVAGMLLGFSLLAWTGCASKPEPLQAGHDVCSFCKMTVTDVRFGGEVITKKGKIYKFDDIICMKNYLKSNLKSSEQIKYNLVTNYLKPQELLSVEQAVFYQDFALRTPMGSNACAFSSKTEAIQFKESKEGKIIDWQSL